MPSPTAELTYSTAINAALTRALSDLPEAILFGEDVAVPGGVFGVTRGLRKQFGDRVFDTPISEAAILGSAIGAAMVGRRPIAEIMWVDFTLVALDQIVNQAANIRYVSRGEASAPITIRTQQGSAPGACAQHSQSLEAFFAHVPGLRVCMPASPQDAYDLLLAAIYCDDPALVIENRTLYHGPKSTVTIGGGIQPAQGARIMLEGTELTLVTWGAMTAKALVAARQCAEAGIGVEVIDMRWLRPLDMPAVLASVAKTGRLAVAHEAHLTGGVGAEIVAQVAESGFPLRSRPCRVATPDVRVPAAPALAAAVIPSADRITDAVLRAAGIAR
jgi:acetoin:2,6-dichlorophenolindophenol oxidoreductase subunit beta